MISTTSLQHPNLRCKLHGAMIRAAAQSRTSFAKYGAHFATQHIEVIHRRRLSHDCGPAGFEFQYNGLDITSTVLKALRTVE